MPVNYGINEEKVLTQKIDENDTILERTTELFFNKFGLVDSVITNSNIVPDTVITIFSYDKSKVLWMKEYQYGNTDTIIHVATEWDKENRGIKFVPINDATSPIIYKNKNCRGVNKKVYLENSLVYSIDYEWNENLVTRTINQFYGDLQKSIGKSSDTTTFDYISLDKKANWMKRIMNINEMSYLEIRSLKYY